MRTQTASGMSTITLSLSADGRLEVVVEDDGVGFDGDGVADWKADELGEGGMGLAIIRAVADEVDDRSAGKRVGHPGPLHPISALSADSRVG